MTGSTRSVLTSLLALGMSASGAGAQQGAGPSPEGALFLLLPIGAQAVSLGRAMTAVQGPESAFWNPAGLATVDDSRLVLLRSDHFAGRATAVTGLGVIPGVATLGASYFLLDAGEVELTDRDGNFIGNVTLRNHLGVLSGAAEIFDRVDAGINLKVIQFRASCRGLCPDAGTAATTYAVDLGVQLRPSADLPLRVGAMIAHLGPRLQTFNAEQADPLPSRLRVAVAYDVLSTVLGSDVATGWVTAELQDRLRDPGSLSLFLGTELSAGARDALFLRAGYELGDLDQDEGASVGLGLRYQRFEFAIAKSLAVSTLTGETEPSHVTFSIVF